MVRATVQAETGVRTAVQPRVSRNREGVVTQIEVSSSLLRLLRAVVNTASQDVLVILEVVIGLSSVTDGRLLGCVDLFGPFDGAILVGSVELPGDLRGARKSDD